MLSSIKVLRFFNDVGIVLVRLLWDMLKDVNIDKLLNLVGILLDSVFC